MAWLVASGKEMFVTSTIMGNWDIVLEIPNQHVARIEKALKLDVAEQLKNCRERFDREHAYRLKCEQEREATIIRTSVMKGEIDKLVAENGNLIRELEKARLSERRGKRASASLRKQMQSMKKEHAEAAWPITIRECCEVVLL